VNDGQLFLLRPPREGNRVGVNRAGEYQAARCQTNFSWVLAGHQAECGRSLRGAPCCQDEVRKTVQQSGEEVRQLFRGQQSARMMLASVVISAAIRIFSSVYTEPGVNEGMEPKFQLRRAFVRGQTGVVPSFPSTPSVLTLSSIRGAGAPFNDIRLVCSCFLIRFQRVGHRTALANVLFAEMTCSSRCIVSIILWAICQLRSQQDFHKNRENRSR
jgi:hypothetical protein